MSLYPNNPIILVDDEQEALTSMEMTLESVQFSNIVQCPRGDQVWSILRKKKADLIVLDIVMPGVSGEDLLEQIHGELPDVPVIMVTGLNDIETAVRCIKKGAHDYILKPIERERFIAGVRHALEIQELRREYNALTEKFLNNKLHHPEAFTGIITAEPIMHSIFRYIEAAAPTSHPVLITGETGVGKELIAHAIHDVSGRKGEFVAVNAAGLDDTMFADTLFGHVKGAFTGAGERRPGLIERAEGGTLFLDEIGDLSLVSQVKLIRLLQEREYLPLGSDMAKGTTARVVVATCKDIVDLRDSTDFRTDLFYRLRTHHIHIPALRERKGDLQLLTEYFLEHTAKELNKPVPTVPKELYTLLNTYHFPGNIRELQAMVLDTVVNHTGKMLSTSNFRKKLGLPVPNGSSQRSIENNEIAVDTTLLTFHERLPSFKEAQGLLVQEALTRAKGNKTLAANLLGITRQALSQRMSRKNV